jgi:hypothetical protein
MDDAIGVRSRTARALRVEDVLIDIARLCQLLFRYRSRRPVVGGPCTTEVPLEG